MVFYYFLKKGFNLFKQFDLFIYYPKGGDKKMNSIVFLFLAAIFAGFALVHLPEVALLTGLTPILNLIGVLAIIIFSIALLVLALKALFKKPWH
jgi:hypothetical protein